MTKLFQETEVNTANLVEHFIDSGLVPIDVHENQIAFRTATGIAYSITIIGDKKFIQIGTCLPLDRRQTRQTKLDFEHRLNTDVFLPTFSLDSDDDLLVMYHLPYAHGLIAGQLVAIVHRFTSVLNFIVQSADHDDLIDFNTSTNDDQDTTAEPFMVPAGVVLN